ncbi:MAG: putative DNA binding domain-containing protein [Gammaproteobacteria bacterium]
MLSQSQILEKIAAGESSGAEFKEVMFSGEKVREPHRDGLSDEIAAFANQRGGALIFGVSDAAGRISGIQYPEAVVTLISEICRDSIEPPVTGFYVDSIRVADALGKEKTLVYVEIDKSQWLHKSKNGYFYRHGNSKREMNTSQVLRIGQSRSQAMVIPFVEQPVPNTGLNTLSEELYARFIPGIPAHDDHAAWLRKRRLLVENNGKTNASVAGVLMCCRTPTEHLPGAFIQAVCYRGTTKDANYQLDAKDFAHTPDSQIVDAYRFVDKYNAVSATKKIGREEHPQYSMRAVFEALVNAVVHRDYSKHGSKIRLFMFSDRLEIYSPGDLANTLTVDNLRFNQVTRNEMLARLLSELNLENDVHTRVGKGRFLERRGEGIEIILRESSALSGKEPVYTLRDEELCLTIFAASQKPQV